MTETTTAGAIPAGNLAVIANEVTGAEYRGRNVERLMTAAVSAGYNPDRGWAGFTQWRSVGRTVRKGEHGTPCFTVVSVDKDKNGRGTTKPRGFRVFHYDQTEELPTAENVGHAPDIDLANGY
jgi:antirestriction protein ArdC